MKKALVIVIAVISILAFLIPYVQSPAVQIFMAKEHLDGAYSIFNDYKHVLNSIYEDFSLESDEYYNIYYVADDGIIIAGSRGIGGETKTVSLEESERISNEKKLALEKLVADLHMGSGYITISADGYSIVTFKKGPIRVQLDYCPDSSPYIYSRSAYVQELEKDWYVVIDYL